MISLPVESSMSEAMNRLRRQYHDSFGEKLAELQQAWRQAAEGHWSSDAREPLRAAAHRLAGSGGGYGFHELSRLSRALELQLNTLPAEGTDSTSGFEADYRAISRILSER